MMHLLLALTLACAQDVEDATLTRDLDAFVERALASDIAPGLAVAVVRGSTIVYAKGFGFADKERGVKATADTEFYIASTTKSFTALAAALLEARGALDLDTPLSRALPRAKLHAQIDGGAIPLRSLLTMTHGIKGGGPVDFRLAYTGDITNDRALELLVHHGPAPGGRAFAYGNLGYNVFGLVLDDRFKGGWRQTLQQEVFDPLGMKSTTAWMSKADPARLAQPYRLRPAGLERIEYAKEDANMQSGGGHVSTANDLARYLVAHLNGGKIDGRQALPEAPVKATQRQHVEQPAGSEPFARVGWGLGWDIATYDGDTILLRPGGFPGFSSHLSFMPARGMGVVVLGNGTYAGAVADVVATYAYDRALAKADLAARTERRSKALTEMVARTRDSIEKDLARRRARDQTTPLPLDAYAGTYENAVWGRLVWTVEKGRLRVRMGVARSDVEVYDGAKHQLRVELTGNGTVAMFDVPEGSKQPSGLRYMNETFKRVE